MAAGLTAQLFSALVDYELIYNEVTQGVHFVVKSQTYSLEPQECGGFPPSVPGLICKTHLYKVQGLLFVNASKPNPERPWKPENQHYSVKEVAFSGLSVLRHTEFSQLAEILH